LSKPCPSAADSRARKNIIKTHQNPLFVNAMACFRPISALRAGWHGPCDTCFEPDEKLATKQVHQPLGDLP
jgi:hypothetical protein